MCGSPGTRRRGRARAGASSPPGTVRRGWRRGAARRRPRGAGGARVLETGRSARRRDLSDGPTNCNTGADWSVGAPGRLTARYDPDEQSQLSEQSGGEASSRSTVPSSSQSPPKVTPTSPGAATPSSRSGADPGTVNVATSHAAPHSTSPLGTLVTRVQSPLSTSRVTIVQAGCVVVVGVPGNDVVVVVVSVPLAAATSSASKRTICDR